MKPTKCLLDMDGVLANFVAGMCSRHGRTSPYLDPANFGNFEMAEPWGMDQDTFWSVADLEFWVGLPVLDGAYALVAGLEHIFGRENICILSAPPKESVDCVRGKLLWLKEHFGDYANSFLMGPKKEFCAAPNHLLVDDYDRNVDKFRAAGGSAVQVPRPWNRLHKLSHRAIEETLLNVALWSGESDKIRVSDR